MRHQPDARTSDFRNKFKHKWRYRNSRWFSNWENRLIVDISSSQVITPVLRKHSLSYLLLWMVMNRSAAGLARQNDTGEKPHRRVSYWLRFQLLCRSSRKSRLLNVLDVLEKDICFTIYKNIYITTGLISHRSLMLLANLRKGEPELNTLYENDVRFFGSSTYTVWNDDSHYSRWFSYKTLHFVSLLSQ